MDGILSTYKLYALNEIYGDAAARPLSVLAHFFTSLTYPAIPPSTHSPHGDPTPPYPSQASSSSSHHHQQKHAASLFFSPFISSFPSLNLLLLLLLLLVPSLSLTFVHLCLYICVYIRGSFTFNLNSFFFILHSHKIYFRSFSDSLVNFANFSISTSKFSRLLIFETFYEKMQWKSAFSAYGRNARKMRGSEGEKIKRLRARKKEKENKQQRGKRHTVEIPTRAGR